MLLHVDLLYLRSSALLWRVVTVGFSPVSETGKNDHLHIDILQEEVYLGYKKIKRSYYL